MKDIDWNSIRAAPGNAWDWLVDAWRRPTAFDIIQWDTVQFYVGDPYMDSLEFISEKPVEIAGGLSSERQAVGNYQSAQMTSLGIITGVAELGVDILDYATPDEHFGLFARWHGNTDVFSSSIDSAHFSSGRFLGYEGPLMFLGPEMLFDDAFRLGSFPMSYHGPVVDWSALRASTMSELRYWGEMYEYTSYRSPYLVGPAHAVPPKPVRIVPKPRAPIIFTEYDLVPYNNSMFRTPGLEKHHAILNEWAIHNVPGYTGKNAPTILLTPENHAATKAVFRDWLELNYGRPVGVSPNWSSISRAEIMKLNEAMMDAAGIPQSVRTQYYELFDVHILGN